MLMVIFDTSLIVDVARKKKSALDLIESYSGKEQLATTIITKYEMLRGATKQDVIFVTELLKKFIIFDFDEDSVGEVVRAYQRLSEKGKMINELDIIIAGIASANSQTLITKDTDFLNLQSNKIIVLPNH
jgi:predicted nucleic acid-binding protein